MRLQACASQHACFYRPARMCTDAQGPGDSGGLWEGACEGKAVAFVFLNR